VTDQSDSTGNQAIFVDSETLHLLPGLNADQYAADMRGLLASGE
jgi:hypothetical protein